MAICDHCGLQHRIERSQEKENVDRLCSSCAKLVKRDLEIQVSPLEADDLELLLAWRSNPKIYRYFREQEGPLDWDEHITWYHSRSPDRYDFVIYFAGRRVGVVNIDQDDSVGIYLGDFSAHGQGIATASLNWLCDRFEERAPLIAEIHEKNDISQKLFERCSFKRKERDGEWLQYVYEP